MKWTAAFMCLWLGFVTSVLRAKVSHGFEHNSVFNENLKTNSTKRMTFPHNHDDDDDDNDDDDDQEDSNQISNLLDVDPSDEEIDDIFQGISSRENDDGDIQNGYKYKLPMTTFTKTIKDDKNNDILPEDFLESRSKENFDKALINTNKVLRNEPFPVAILKQKQKPGLEEFRNDAKSNDDEDFDQLRTFVDKDRETFPRKEDIDHHEEEFREKERFYPHRDKTFVKEEENSFPYRNDFFSHKAELYSQKRFPPYEANIFSHHEDSPEDDLFHDKSVESSEKVRNDEKLMLMRLGKSGLQNSINVAEANFLPLKDLPLSLLTTGKNNFKTADDELKTFGDRQLNDRYEHHLNQLDDDDKMKVFSYNSRKDVNHFQKEDGLDFLLNHPLNSLSYHESRHLNNDNNYLQKPDFIGSYGLNNDQTENEFIQSNKYNHDFDEIGLSQSINRLIDLIKSEYDTSKVRKGPDNENRNTFNQRQNNQNYALEHEGQVKENLRFKYMNQLNKLNEKFHDNPDAKFNDEENESNDKLLKKFFSEIIGQNSDHLKGSRFDGEIQIGNLDEKNTKKLSSFFQNNDGELVDRKVFEPAIKKIADDITQSRLDISHNILSQEMKKIADRIAAMQLEDKPTNSYKLDTAKPEYSRNSNDYFHNKNEPNEYLSNMGRSESNRPFRETKNFPEKFNHDAEHELKYRLEPMRDYLFHGIQLNHRPFDLLQNENSNKYTRMYNNGLTTGGNIKDYEREGDISSRNFNQPTLSKVDAFRFFKNQDNAYKSFGESLNPKHQYLHGSKITAANIISGPALKNFNKNQEENDFLIRKDLDALNEKETKVAAYEALKDDEILKIAQKIADDSPSDKTDHLKADGSNEFENTDRKNLVPNTNQQEVANDKLPQSSELSSISNDLKKVPSETELKNKIDKGSTQNFNHPNNIRRRQYVSRVPASLEINTKESKRFHIHHIGDYIQRPDLTNNSISIPEDIAITNKIIDNLSSGKDIKHVAGVDHVRVKGHYGPYHFDESAGKPYRYGQRPYAGHWKKSTSIKNNPNVKENSIQNGLVKKTEKKYANLDNVLTASKRTGKNSKNLTDNRRHLGDHFQRPDLAFNGITIPEDIAITNKIIDNLSSGKDIKHVAGIDHVHVKGHYGPYHFDESAGKPYRYGHYPSKDKNVYHQNIYNGSLDQIEPHYHSSSQKISDDEIYHPSYNKKNQLSKGNDIIDGGDVRKPYQYGSRADILKKNFMTDVEPSSNYFTNSQRHQLGNSSVANNLVIKKKNSTRRRVLNLNGLSNSRYQLDKVKKLYSHDHIFKSGKPQRLDKKSSIKLNRESNAYRRQLFAQVQHPHHLVIDNVPIHYGGHRLGSSEPEYVLDHNYAFPARFRTYGRVPFPIKNLGTKVRSKNIYRGHSFDQIFQNIPSQSVSQQIFSHLIGERNPYKVQDTGEAIIASADPTAEKFSSGQDDYYYNGYEPNFLMPMGKPLSILNKHLRYGYIDNGIQIPTNDLVTEKILNYLSAGYDIKDSHGNFIVKELYGSDQAGQTPFGESQKTKPKLLSNSHKPNGNLDDGFNENFPDMEPILRGYHHLSKHQKTKHFVHPPNKEPEVSLDSDQVIDHDDAFNFVPLKGVVVPEKDARKIGLYDRDYLEKLGVWDDYKSHPSTWIDAILRDHDTWGTKGVFNAEARGFNNTLTNNLTKCRVPADVAFLFDGSLGNEKKEKYFNRYIEFAKQVVNYHPPSMQGYHFGAVVYSDIGELKFNFDLAYDLTSVIEELEDIRRTFTSFKEGSRVDLGLKKVKELFEKSGRDWVAQVLIILTDSKSTGDVEAIAQTLRDSTVSIFVIGLANKDSHSDIGQMEKIASQPTQHHVFQIDIEKLLGTTENVAYPQHLARVIPYKICRMNLAFVVDMKESDISRLSAIKEFIKTVTSDLGMGSYGNHISVVGYGGNAGKSGWDFSRFILCGSTPSCNLDRAEYLKAVDSLEKEAGKENDAGSALEKVFGFYFDHSSDGQEYWNYLNVTVILTDRKLDGPYESAARKLRNHGVIVHAVGWLDANKGVARATLAEAASDSDDFYLHTHTGILALENVARRMKQYFSLLLFGHEGHKNKVTEGWEEAEPKNVTKSWSAKRRKVKVLGKKRNPLLRSSKKTKHRITVVHPKKNSSMDLVGLGNMASFWNGSDSDEKTSDSSSALHNMLHKWRNRLFENETQYKEKISNKTASSLEPLLNKEKELLWSISDDSILRHKLLQKLIKSFQVNVNSNSDKDSPNGYNYNGHEVSSSSKILLEASPKDIHSTDKLINKDSDDKVSMKTKLDKQFEEI